MVVAILLSAVGLLIAAELGLRWADRVPLFRASDFDGQVGHPFLVPSNPYIAHHRTLGWTTAPSLAWGFTSTDEYGTRLPSTEPRPLPIGAILASGDSFTAGSEVPNHQSWPAQLEQMLGEPVINAAAGGYATDQIILRAEQMIEIAKPHTVIVSFLWHDIMRSENKTFAQAHKPYYEIENDELVLRNDPVPLFSYRFAGNRALRAALSLSYLAFCVARWTGVVKCTDAGQSEVATPEGTGLVISKKLLSRIKSQADAEGFRLMFLVQYGNLDFGSEQPRTAREIIDHARAIGIQTVDPWEMIAAVYDSDRQRFRGLWVLQQDGVTLGHMSEAGNRLIAELLTAPSSRGQALRSR